MHRAFLPFVIAFFAALAGPTTFATDSWRGGAARVDITPNFPVRLNGYGSRKTEFEAVEQHLFAKALALTDSRGAATVLVTVDNCAVPGAIRDELARRLAAQAHLADERLALCSSHTHCAPLLAGVLTGIFGMDLPADEQERVDRYTRELTDKLERVALAALAAQEPCTLAWSIGEVGFAGNRRLPTPKGFINSQNPDGPVDHALPVLRVTGADGKVRAIFTSYACHCTTLQFNRVHGDWSGCAQEALEEAFPGAVALIALGCAGDQNPYPRGTVELAIQHGQALAAVAGELVRGPMKSLAPRLDCIRTHFTLPFDTLPTREEFEQRAQDRNPTIAYHARKNLERLDRGEALPTRLEYSVQTWSFGPGLTMVFLPGEAVVDYSLRLKRELDATRLWVNAYSNDVPCYIPSRRVLEEGGYEAAGAMIYYDRPTKFAPQVEELIVQAVHRAMPTAARAGN